MNIHELAGSVSISVTIRGKTLPCRKVPASVVARIKKAFPRPTPPQALFPVADGKPMWRANENDGNYITTFNYWVTQTAAAELAVSIGLKTADGKGHAPGPEEHGWFLTASEDVMGAFTEAEILDAVSGIRLAGSDAEPMGN